MDLKIPWNKLSASLNSLRLWCLGCCLVHWLKCLCVVSLWRIWEFCFLFFVCLSSVVMCCVIDFPVWAMLYWCENLGFSFELIHLKDPSKIFYVIYQHLLELFLLRVFLRLCLRLFLRLFLRLCLRLYLRVCLRVFLRLYLRLYLRLCLRVFLNLVLIWLKKIVIAIETIDKQRRV